MSKTKWDKIVAKIELASVKALRSKPYIVEKVRRSSLPELMEEGWEFNKDYKDPKWISVKKEKPFDEQFEDKVWMLFYKMGFSHLNSDRNFEMSYDFHNPDHTQQIDVFAADDESIIIVECKAAESIKDGVFKKPLEALYAQMDGLSKEARKKFPGRKVKFVWATKNYIITRTDQKKMKDWGIIHFSDAVIDYYSELVKHLGSAAKYQLLGNLFANVEIKNMDDRIPAIRGKMGGFEYYSFSIEPERLLKIGYVLHRNEANKDMMPTYQRLIKRKRLNEIQKFVDKGGYFPNSVIISIDTNKRGVHFEPRGEQVENCISRFGILYLPKKYRSAYIIDGQHRLYGYSDSKYSKTNSIPVVAFVDLDRKEQIKLFMEINENQKAVPKTLRVTLNADMLWDSDDYNERRQALRSKIAQMLAEEETSPLLGRIVSGEDETTSTKCITVEAIQSALKRSDFFSTFGKKNAISKDGTFDLGENQATCDLFYPFIEECLRYIKQHVKEEWDKGDSNGGMLTMNRGMQAVIRVINDIVNMLVKTNVICPKSKSQSLDAMVHDVCFYLDPLIDYLNNLTEEQRKNIRNYFGSGADKRFWRAFQQAIAEKKPDFQPEGLKEFWEDEAKLYNTESVQLLREIEKYSKAIVATKLKECYGNNWVIRGLPKPIYDRAKKEADDQNYEEIRNGAVEGSTTIWDCVTLLECKTIITTGNHWQNLFDDVFTRPEDKTGSGTKESKTNWLSSMNAISNKLLKPSYSVSAKEYEFIKAIHRWLAGR